jgi:hypothetical protein
MMPFFWIKWGLWGALAAAIFAYVFNLGDTYGSSARELARIQANTDEVNHEIDTNNVATEQAIVIADRARERALESLSVPSAPQSARDCSLSAEVRSQIDAIP